MTRRKYLYIFILFLTACGGGDGGSNLGSQQNAAPEFIGLTEYVIDENTKMGHTNNYLYSRWHRGIWSSRIYDTQRVL